MTTIRSTGKLRSLFERLIQGKVLLKKRNKTVVLEATYNHVHFTCCSKVDEDT